MTKRKSISCIIVDDETASQRVLEHFIDDTDILQLKGICSNTKEALKFMSLNEPVDLLFLDINMPQQSGLDFYKGLQSPPKVIFTTAYPQYALEGFEVNAVDYLLKPIAYERFLSAIKKVINSNNPNDTNAKYIILKENKALHKVQFDDILYLEAYGDYVKVFLNEKVVITHSTFTNILRELPDFFIRTHKSFCMNLNKLNHLSGNQITIQSYQIPIGQTYKQNVLKALNIES